MSGTEPGLVWVKRHARDDSLAALRTMKIGPIFPSEPGRRAGITEPRKVVRGGKDTKAPYSRTRRAPKRPNRVAVVCSSCGWNAQGPTWRPLRRALADHATSHRKAA